ncbi:MAG: VOC family protein [Rhodospirillaceae bacterium]|nr:VOC family protein [Rhodospirillaceae bacterium]
MGEIVAPEGSPLSVAVIGVEDMAKSLAFYRDTIGLTAHPQETWAGESFEKLWRLPPGSRAEAVFLELPGVPVGRVLLLQFDAKQRKRIRPNDAPRAFGLVNLNFYTDDIHADSKKLAAMGYKFWSEPMHYNLSSSAGAPTEVIFDGPDSVAINLVELTSTDPATRVGQMRAYVQAHGRTPTGYTPVVTSSHCARNVKKAAEFYQTVLKSGILIDEIMASPQQNHFLRLPEKAKTAVKFIQGNHMFGKIALSQPINYPCHDLVPAAVPPNIGYIAQVFVVKDLAAAEAACAALRCEVFAPRMELDVPGLGRVGSLIVRNPGSGALQQIVQPA